MNTKEAKSSIEKGIGSIWSSRPFVQGEYHVTELCNCIRKAWFMRTRNEPSEKNVFMFNGLLLHNILPKICDELTTNESIDNCVNDLGGYCIFEAKCKYEFDGIKIVGSADLITNDYVYEFKFASNSTSDNINHFNLMYYNQVNAYCNMLKKGKYRIVYINNMDLSVSISEGETNKLSFEQLKDKAIELHKCITTNTIPEQEGNIYCKYCKYKKECDKNE